MPSLCWFVECANETAPANEAPGCTEPTSVKPQNQDNKEGAVDQQQR